MFTEEQKEQFRRDREFMAKLDEEYNRQKQEALNNPLSGSQQEQPVYTTGKKSASGQASIFSRSGWLGNIPYSCKFIKDTNWAKIVIAICCLLIAGSFLLPWFGKLPLYELITNNEIGVFFPLWGIAPRLFGSLLIFSVIVIIYFVFLRRKDVWSVQGRVLLGIPFMLTAMFLISCFASAAVLSNSPTKNLGMGLWLAALCSLPLVIIGIMNDTISGNDKIVRHDKTPAGKILKVLYYAFIWVGVLLICLEWIPLGVELTFWKSVLVYAWPYLSAAVLSWVLFSRYQFLRVWFHLIAAYGLLLFIMSRIWGNGDSAAGFSFSMSWFTGFLFSLIPFVVCICFYLSLYIGRRRSCPSCKTLYGKELLSYAKEESSTVESQTPRYKTVEEYKRVHGSDLNTLGRSANETILVNERSSTTLHHYTTHNHCKKCGYEWQAHESHDKWWQKPM